MRVSQPLWGAGADLWGRRRTLLSAMFLSTVLLLGYLGGATFLFFFAWGVLYTFLSNPVGTLLDSLVLDYLEGRPAVFFGQLRMWGAAGWAVAALLVGYAITGRDIRLIFIFGALLMLIGWLLAWRRTSETAGDRAFGQTWTGLGTLLRNRRLLLFLGMVTLLQIGAASIFSFYAVYMNKLGASRQLIGFAFTLQGLSELPLYLTAAQIIRRIGSSRTVILAFLVFATRAFLYSVISVPLFAMMVEMLHGLSLVAAVDLVNREVPSQWRATGQSLFWAAYFGAGSILGNTWAGFLYDRIGVQAMFRVNGSLILAIALCASLFLREPRVPVTE
jgi:PPP family 3-phenylpropionic acid transporter